MGQYGEKDHREEALHFNNLTCFKCNIQIVEENPDWNRCIDENSLKLGRCVHSCESNQECENDCINRFKTRQVNCPCEVLKKKYF